MTLYKTQLSLGAVDLQQEEAFFEYCQNSPHITYLVKQIGGCPLEIEIEAPDSITYFRIIDEMERLFPDFIRSTDTILIRNEKLKWIKT